MHEIVKYFILTEIRWKFDRRTLDPLKSIECGAGRELYRRFELNAGGLLV